MTLDSDDEGPTLPQSKVEPRKKSTKKDSAKDKLRAKKTTKKQKQQLKRVLDTELSDSGSSAEEDEATLAEGDGGVGKMDKGFVFDGLGGGFVGDRRNNVWVSRLCSGGQQGKLLILSFVLLRRIREKLTSDRDQTQS